MRTGRQGPKAHLWVRRAFEHFIEYVQSEVDEGGSLQYRMQWGSR
jgi:hypothetical protein